MAISIKKSDNTTNISSLVSQFCKDIGDGVATIGHVSNNSDRIPTGLFELDLALGGGFPRGKASMIYGAESSNKTNISLRAIANHQRLWPDKTCVFIDLENEFNQEWAEKLGVGVSKLAVLRPNYAEQVVDMMEGIIDADDCGLIVLDSVAAMVSTAELSKSAEGETPGGNARVMGKLYRKTTVGFSNAAKRNLYPSLIYINQIRYKIGVMFGSPETTPGGPTANYQSSLILRVHGANIIDKNVSSVMPVRKEVKFTVRKHKYPILATSGKFEMTTIPHGKLQIGQCDDAGTIKQYLDTFGDCSKQDKGGWLIKGELFPTLKVWKDKLYSDQGYGDSLRSYIISVLLNNGEILESSEG